MSDLLNQIIGTNNEDYSKEEREQAKELFFTYLDKGLKTGSSFHKQLLEEFEEGSPITGQTGLRKKLAAVDLEYFGRAYFPDYFVRKSPQFHRELDQIWKKGVLKGIDPLEKDASVKLSRRKGSRRAIAAPRGHAKSTTFTFKDTIHAILYLYKHYILIISDSSEQAEGFLQDIKSELEENKAIIQDFGEQKGRVWRDSVILTKKDIKVEAIGSGKKVRGRRHRNWRPDLIVLDDIENDENVNTKEQRKKLSNWFFKAVSKAGDDYTDIVYIGTILHYDSLLSSILKNPGYRSIKYKAVISFAKNQHLWDYWETIYTDLDNETREEDALKYFQRNEKEMLEKTQVLWEEKLSYYDLMEMRLTEGEASFNSEEQNEPINPDDTLFNEEWFDYYNEAEINFSDSRFLYVGFVDPSLGKNKKSDTSSIIGIAKDVLTGYMYVIIADIDRRHPDLIISDTLESEKRLRRDYGRGYTKYGCETNQFQWFLKEQLAKESAKENLYLPIEEVNQTSNKEMRIATLQPDIKNGYLKFNPRHKTLLEQLKHYPMAANDDGPDALEACVKIAKTVSKSSTKHEYETVSTRRFGRGRGY